MVVTKEDFHLDEKVVVEHGMQVDGYRGQEPPAGYIPVCVVCPDEEHTEVTVAHNQTKVRELLSPYDYRPKAWWYVPKEEALKEAHPALASALEF
jgi:hypothetical protein